jgi:hypothetical protein
MAHIKCKLETGVIFCNAWDDIIVREEKTDLLQQGAVLAFLQYWLFCSTGFFAVLAFLQ